MHIEIRLSFFSDYIDPLNQQVYRLFVCAGLENFQPRLDLFHGEIRRRRGLLELGNLCLDGLHLPSDIGHHLGGQGPSGQIFHEGVILPLLLLDPALDCPVEVRHPVLLPGLVLTQGCGYLVLVLWGEQLVKVIHRGIVHFIHMNHGRTALFGAVVAEIFVPFPCSSDPMHLCSALAVYKAAA